MSPIRVEEVRVRSFDGTDLACHVTGEGPTVLLANGLGGSWRAWTHQIGFFDARYRFVSWDYRGLYRSGAPGRHDALRVEDHARDALAVLDHLRVDRAALMGWSMGVQVGLELFRLSPDRLATMVLVNGVAGRPWQFLGNQAWLSRAVVPRVLRSLQRLSPVTQAVTGRVTRWPEIVAWAKRAGLASPTLDEELWHELAQTFADLDMKRYMRVLELLGEHDAHDLLGELDVPVLIIAGSKDLLTPRAASERMLGAIRGAELMVVPGGTHYVAVEYPELVNLRVEKFFAERGYPP